MFIQAIAIVYTLHFSPDLSHYLFIIGTRLLLSIGRYYFFIREERLLYMSNIKKIICDMLCVCLKTVLLLMLYDVNLPALNCSQIKLINSTCIPVWYFFA